MHLNTKVNMQLEMILFLQPARLVTWYMNLEKIGVM
jgi:hypothetical protein